jgi:hypothetical protein
MKKLTQVLLFGFSTLFSFSLWAEEAPVETVVEDLAAVEALAAVEELLKAELEAAQTPEAAEASIVKASNAGLPSERISAVVFSVSSINLLLADIVVLEVLARALVSGPPPVIATKIIANDDTEDPTDTEDPADTEGPTVTAVPTVTAGLVGGSRSTNGDGGIPVGVGDESNTGQTYNDK